MRSPLLVLLERDDFTRELYTDALVERGFRVRSETQLDEALAAVERGAQLLIAGIGPGSVAVAELAAQLRRVAASTPLVVVLARDAAEGTARALRDGALEALAAPVSADALALTVARCLETTSLFAELPELRQHVELYLAAQRLQRASNWSSLARELLSAAAAHLPAAGLAIATAPGVRDGGELIAAHGLGDDDVRALMAAWNPQELKAGRPAADEAAPLSRCADRVLTYPPGTGPFGAAGEFHARPQQELIALRIGPGGAERLWVMLFPSTHALTETGTLDATIATHLSVLAAQASFAVDAAARFPAGLESSIDPLTDLNDGRFFDQTLEHELRRHGHRGGAGVAVVVVQIDAAQDIYDSHGALVGERLLVEAARLLVRGVRDIDLVARTGANRFELLLLGTDAESAQRAAARMRLQLAEHRFMAREGLGLRVPIPVGVAAYPQDGESAVALRSAAAGAAHTEPS